MHRFTWRHDSVLNFIANNLPSAQIQKIFADLPSLSNPSIITGDDYRPDILILTKDNTLYVLELTVGYETNLRNNINRKYSKYKELIKELKRKLNCVKFINLSVSALGVFDNESAAFIDMLERLDVNKNHVTYYIEKIITIAIRSTYYFFCCGNKEWTKPNLIKSSVVNQYVLLLSVVNQYVRKWLQVPISGRLSNIYHSYNKFGQNIYPPSLKFIQCQTVLCKALKSSPN